MNADTFSLRLHVETEEGWQSLAKRIPYLKFKSSWDVQIVPPFSGAMVRFIIFNPKNKNKVSVYLDSLDRLGIEHEPYWELYKISEKYSEPIRFPMKEITLLMNAITSALD